MSRQLEQTDQLYKSGMVQKKIAERRGITEGAVTYRLQRYREIYRIKKPPLPPRKSKPKKTNFLPKKIRSQMAQDALRQRGKGRSYSTY